MTSNRTRAALGDHDPGPRQQATGFEPPIFCDFCGSEALHIMAEHGRSTFTARCADCTASHLIATANTEDTIALSQVDECPHCRAPVGRCQTDTDGGTTICEVTMKEV